MSTWPAWLAPLNVQSTRALRELAAQKSTTDDVRSLVQQELARRPRRWWHLPGV